MYKKIISVLFMLEMIFCIGVPLADSGLMFETDISASAETSGDYEYELLDDEAVEITRWNDLQLYSDFSRKLRNVSIEKPSIL